MVDEKLPTELRQSFYALFSAEKHEIDERNSQAIGAIIAQQASRGLATSGATMSLIATELANSIPERVLRSTKIMQRVIAAYGHNTSIEAKAEIVALLHKLVADQREHLRAKALGTAPFQRASQAARDAALSYIDLKARLETSRISGEIDLMAANKEARPPLDVTAYKILALLREEFAMSGRQASELTSGYVGPSLPAIQNTVMAHGDVSQVDFDLSLSALEKNGLAKTGPTVPYDNQPGSSVFILAFISKREYLVLSEEGYRAAAAAPKHQAASPERGPSVTIHGGTFNNSPVGAGVTVTQKINIDVTNENETVNYLYELLSRNNGDVDASARQNIEQMLAAANAGDMKAAKPIYQKLFGAAASEVRELATGVLTAIVNKQLGL